MSTLDQAFIKAYRKEANEYVRPARAADVWPASLARPAKGAVYDPPLHTDAPHAAVPPPHVAFRGAQPAWASPAAPLSAFIVQPTVAPLEPAYEVPQFVWPAIVHELMARAVAECAACGALLSQRGAQQRQVVLVTGGARGQGRSTVALLLARATAQRGARVAVVDADLRRPQLAELLGVTTPVSWDAVLGNRQPIDEALIESSLERVTLMPLAAPAAWNGAWPNLAPAINALREHYDLVLIDAGPLDEDAAAVNLAAVLVGCPIDDGVIVRDTGRAAPTNMPALARRLAAAGVRRWDLIDNFARTG